MIHITAVIEDSTLVVSFVDGLWVGRMVDTYTGKAADVKLTPAEFLSTLALSIGIGEEPEPVPGFDIPTLYTHATPVTERAGFGIIP